MRVLLFSIIIFTSNTGYSQFARETYHSDTVGEKGLTDIRFVGTGDVQLALQNQDEIAASTGLGVVFWRIWPNKDFGTSTNKMSGTELQLEIKVDVASTTDTLTAFYEGDMITNNRVFGSYVLAPTSSGQATTMNSVWYFKPVEFDPETDVTKRRLSNFNFIDGMELSGVVANQVWRTNLSSGNVSVFAWRVGIFHEFIPDGIRRKKGYSIRFGSYYSGRSIQGDVGRDSGIRTQLLLNDETTYHGIEFALALRLQNIRVEASVPYMHTGSSRPIPGLSGVQFIPTISFVGGFPLDLTNN